MKYSLLSLVYLMLINTPAIAIDAKEKRSALPESEPVKCYKIAWGTKDNPGLGLTVGQAVALCSGTDNGIRTATCFAQAWSHLDDGGLGLTAGQAVSLCKSNSSQ